MKLEVIEPKPIKPPKTFVLTLTEPEAAELYRTLGKSGGSWHIYLALDKQGFDSK